MLKQKVEGRKQQAVTNLCNRRNLRMKFLSSGAISTDDANYAESTISAILTADS